MKRKIDATLGMNRSITRRDLLHDAGLVSVFGGLSGGVLAGCSPEGLPHPERAPGYYPPSLNGLRGSHPGSFEAAHDAAFSGRKFPAGQDTGEEQYDLVVVGGGVSGLAAAWFFRQRFGEGSRILILDNHDDFGGHAKRNEFEADGERLLAWGGSINLEYPGYSEVSLGILGALGVDIDALKQRNNPFKEDQDGLERAVYFDAATYGRDVVVRGLNLASGDTADILSRVADLPISGKAQASLARFLSSTDDVLSPMTREERMHYLRKTTYWSFLTEKCGVDPEAAQIFIKAPQGYWGVASDALDAALCIEMGFPGAHVIGETAHEFGRYTSAYGSVQFPDGNASVARLLVRSLVPGVASGDTMEDIVSASFDYSRLDADSSKVRIRLQSIVIDARNDGSGVRVDYLQGDEVYRVRGRRCVLACYNMMIPYLCPDVPAPQKEALNYLVKHPLVVINVLLANGRAAQQAGVVESYCPGRLLGGCRIVAGMASADAASAWDLERPVIQQFYGGIGATGQGLDAREQNRAGRRKLLAMSFEDFEREVRETLSGLYVGTDFDAAGDILAITVNRWPHGYAYEYFTTADPDWAPGQAPHEIGRRPIGNIAIANSDSGAKAYLDSAIDQAYRAVSELS
jgi:spermidine dehydrogenase